MWRIETRREGATLHQRLHDARGPMSWRAVIDAWCDRPDFALWFSAQLAAAPFTALRWETPALSRDRLDHDHEQVLLDAPELVRDPEPEVFAAHLRVEAPVVRFLNLGGDAELVVPVPQRGDEDYSHLAAFVRSAGDAQQAALWQLVGTLLRARVGAVPLWLSTAGDGVAWLHLRLDQRPKYYHHAPYRQP